MVNRKKIITNVIDTQQVRVEAKWAVGVAASNAAQ